MSEPRPIGRCSACLGCELMPRLAVTLLFRRVDGCLQWNPPWFAEDKSPGLVFVTQKFVRRNLPSERPHMLFISMSHEGLWGAVSLCQALSLLRVAIQNTTLQYDEILFLFQQWTYQGPPFRSVILLRRLGAAPFAEDHDLHETLRRWRQDFPSCEVCCR